VYRHIAKHRQRAEIARVAWKHKSVLKDMYPIAWQFPDENIDIRVAKGFAINILV
jgi:hypothetical protein